ncbi:MAG: GatB/YqeY domain-containing protein [Pseudomonadota bacterium]
MSADMKSKLSDHLKAAVKDKAAVRASTLRLILAAIKDREIAARAEDRCSGITDDEVLQLLSKMVKQRVESATTYEENGRLDLADRERQEIDIIEEFMPRQLDDQEIEAAVSAVVTDIGASGLKDIGRCMGVLKERYAGSMDFSKASALVKGKLKDSQPSA